MTAAEVDPEGRGDPHAEILEGVRRDASASGEPLEEAFFRRWAELAADNGDCIDLDYVPVRREGRGGWRIDGIAVDAERAELHVAVGQWHVGSDAVKLRADGLKSLMQGVARFLTKSLDPEWLDALEETSPAFEAAMTVSRNIDEIGRVRLLVLTNATVGIRSSVGQANLIKRPTTCSWIDLARYLQIANAGLRNEPIEIDIATLNGGGPLACLEAASVGTDYRSYLLAMPAPLLARIYADYGPRLLEQNVRTFLQARTKVNRGIIETVEQSPERFFAYNNGLTATASAVEFEHGVNGGTAITMIRDLQIVNGGQTTASILYAKDRRGANLSAVTVPMKLSVVPAERLDDFVPLVSRYANSQNRISETDFAAGEAIHVGLERISRQLSAPVRAGALVSTKWFYERARGQYRDARSRLSGVGLRRFEAEFPSTQTIQKTDLAKYVMAFECRPDIVSLGAQKCFAQFADAVRELEEAGRTFDEAWYRQVISMAIVFRWVDQHVSRSEWYRAARGHKAPIVAYTVAGLQRGELEREGRPIDCERVWRQQDITEALAREAACLAPEMARQLRDTPPGVTNVSEYAKKPACRTRIIGTLDDSQRRLLPLFLDGQR